MLERLRIRRFRGFDDLQIDGLSWINLVAGRNNAGKSTLLGAIFLLGGAGDPHNALNTHIVRMQPGAASPPSVWETLWMPLFAGLDSDGGLTIAGCHSSVGDMTLTVALERPVTTEASRTGNDGASMEGFGARHLKFTYVDSKAGRIESEARATGSKVTYEWKEDYVAFGGSILQPGRGDIKEDAIHLGRLRRQKRGDLLL